ncbi:MAG: methylated-DNA--[protein]-cysteine S-methyltransferase [Clostridia bacterium]|nr:methylated-DNA--[protein]-cysteine S-methyltransferase [Clostridia bacterium]
MHFIYHSPLGEITVASDGEGITNLSIEGQTPVEDENRVEAEDFELFRKAKSWLDQYFSGEIPREELPLRLNCGEFRREVYEILLKIPYGNTITYAEIARRIADARGIRRMSAQAVGGAVGHNPISIIIPCHRVIGTNGSLTGYGGGLHLKRKLLEIEGISLSR